ncbi:twin-arginine translocation signal domain-containing protein [Halomarina halobia]|uniref:Twin-arginine translocation signal domain-containing protein n=1 Tax=Halomarina halobia TaxID=3033386 RepID=A0ABD6A7M5_9EURY
MDLDDPSIPDPDSDSRRGFLRKTGAAAAIVGIGALVPRSPPSTTSRSSPSRSRPASSTRMTSTPPTSTWPSRISAAPPSQGSGSLPEAGVGLDRVANPTRVGFVRPGREKRGW